MESAVPTLSAASPDAHIVPSAPRCGRRRPWSATIALIFSLALFGLPLFLGLGRSDLRNDEPIYAYAVERILETGEWLTPRSIPSDGPFLEKPPLKFWIVAAALSAGLLPDDELGMRFLDALCGLAGFLYIFLFGLRLQRATFGAADDHRLGGIAALVALLVLFTLDPLIFEHGLRSNNMEAPLFLAYCGGLYHLARWIETTASPGEDPSRRSPARRHAFAAALYFVLGFMTKFVAALFLPLVALLALAWRRDGWAVVRRGWTDWLLPGAAAVALIAPWFVYQTIHSGSEFWAVILGVHVVTRFTSALDPNHLQPWHFYFVQTWKELELSRSRLVVAAGLPVLLGLAWRGRPWLARLLLLWWLVPFALMSLGTSKLYHYALPFLPPLALGAGLAGVGFLRALETLAHRYDLLRHVDRAALSLAGRRRLRIALLATAGAAFLAGVWTALFGPFSIWAGDLRVFRNSSVPRPLAIAGLLFLVTGPARVKPLAIGALALIVVLPLTTYVEKVRKLSTVQRPFSALRDCIEERIASGAAERRGVLVSDPLLLTHAYYYYLRRTGPWDEGLERLYREARRRLSEPGHETPVILSLQQLEDLAGRLRPEIGIATAPADLRSADPSRWQDARQAALAREASITLREDLFEASGLVRASALPVPRVIVRGIVPGDQVAILLPGPYDACVAPAVAAGARPLAPPGSPPAP